ncbi:MAG: glycosyltransferase [Thiohalocapsa sp.]
MTDALDVFVGTDRSQLLAVAVLEYSIRRHTRETVRVFPLIDLDLPEPKDLRHGSRTNFSFARFAIPALKGYRGKGLYLDADMLVFRDIAALWRLPFDGATILIQGELSPQIMKSNKIGAPTTRKKQCSVMMIDCAAAKWHAPTIIEGLDGQYTYDQLMSEMCILREEQVGYTLPFEWNSLEYYDENTCLIHYTDMHTQPWVSTENGNGYLWLAEVRRMLNEGVLTWTALQTEIDLGYFRPSLIDELNDPGALEGWSEERAQQLAAIDAHAGFVKHAEVYARKKARAAAVKAYEAQLALRKPQPAAGPGEPAVATERHAQLMPA